MEALPYGNISRQNIQSEQNFQIEVFVSDWIFVSDWKILLLIDFHMVILIESRWMFCVTQCTHYHMEVSPRKNQLKTDISDWFVCVWFIFYLWLNFLLRIDLHTVTLAVNKKFSCVLNCRHNHVEANPKQYIQSETKSSACVHFFDWIYCLQLNSWLQVYSCIAMPTINKRKSRLVHCQHCYMKVHYRQKNHTQT